MTTTTTDAPAALGQSRVLDGEVLARGVPIVELVEHMDYVSMLFFQLLAREPSPSERRIMDAYLVSLCEHGVTSPSTHGSRAAASVRAPFAASAVSFIASAMGAYHFGALEMAMHEVGAIVRGGGGCGEGGEGGGVTVESTIEAAIAEGRRVWGFGHRFHRSVGVEAHPPRAADALREHQELADPRVRALTALLDAEGWDGPHVRTVRALGRALYQRKRIPINIDGLGAGILLDMGFEPGTALLFVIIGRLPNIARLHQEEQDETPNRFVGLAERVHPGFDVTVDREQG